MSSLVLVFPMPYGVKYVSIEFWTWQNCMEVLVGQIYPYIVAHGIPLMQGYCS